MIKIAMVWFVVCLVCAAETAGLFHNGETVLAIFVLASTIIAAANFGAECARIER